MLKINYGMSFTVTDVNLNNMNNFNILLILKIVCDVFLVLDLLGFLIFGN